MLLTKVKYKNFIGSGISYTTPDLDSEIKNLSLQEGSPANLNVFEKRAIKINRQVSIRRRKFAYDSRSNLTKLPVVIAFYSTAWGNLWIEFLKSLEKIKSAIEWREAELLVLSADNEKELLKIIEDCDLTLSIYQDTENKIAKYFGVYNEEKPVWHYISGIETNTCYLSLFVVSEQKTITYKHLYLSESSTFDKSVLLAIS